MITVKEETTLVGVSELRTSPERIFKEMEKRPVVIERHRKPIAVLVPVKKFEEMEKLFDLVEDYVLGSLAKEREKKHKNPKWVSVEEAWKRVGLRP